MGLSEAASSVCVGFGKLFPVFCTCGVRFGFYIHIFIKDFVIRRSKVYLIILRPERIRETELYSQYVTITIRHIKFCIEKPYRRHIAVECVVVFSMSLDIYIPCPPFQRVMTHLSSECEFLLTGLTFSAGILLQTRTVADTDAVTMGVLLAIAQALAVVGPFVLIIAMGLKVCF